ncbi:MAG: hypothetical protein JF606_26430 [Burkholderiales bacterium]|nr:hypothetical protein [Burkholderiales bacterium]
MDTTRFEQLLKQTMSLDAASIGSAAVERAVQERLSACRLADAQTYWERLSGSGTELQELIEAVVVPETWFFRDPPSFVALANRITTSADPSRPVAAKAGRRGRRASLATAPQPAAARRRGLTCTPRRPALPARLGQQSTIAGTASACAAMAPARN